MTRTEILSAAEKAITGQRTQDYGRAENSFCDIAALWSAYKYVDFTPHDVAVMMALMKIARIKTGHDVADSYVDLCGYGAIAGELADIGDPTLPSPHTAVFQSETGGFPVEKRGLSDIEQCCGCTFFDAKNMLCKHFLSRINNGKCEYGFSALEKKGGLK